jgi:hypothetical protein
MPALGYTVAEDMIRAEYARLDSDAFLRSYLNVWPDEAPHPEWLLIGEEDWLALADPRSQIVGRPAFAWMSARIGRGRISASLGAAATAWRMWS